MKPNTFTLKIAIQIFLSLTFTSQGISMGFGEWSHTTKHGITINNIYGANIIKWKEGQIDCVGKWYYYKNYIIGETEECDWVDTTSYFILNEITKELTLIKNKSQWKRKVEESKLDPLFARWHTAHDEIQVLIILSTFYWFFSIPVFFFISVCLIKIFVVASKAKFRINNWSVKLLIFLFALVSLLVISLTNYNSF